MKFNKFIFESYEFDYDAGSASFHYSFDGQLKFTESIQFESKITSSFNKKQIRKTLELYHLVAGVSYYKAYFTPEIEVKSTELDQSQAEFLNNLYLKGLGEYLYINELDPNDIAKFQPNKAEVTSEQHDYSTEQLRQGTLVMIGGGKDSLVTAELLERGGKDFASFRINSLPWVDKQMKMIGQPVLKVRRDIDSKLTELNKKDAYNGHVPLSAINSALAVIAAVLFGYEHIIISSESSADIPNTKYKGMDINHQYSKSYEFEQALASYIHKYISPNIKYFSLLRPYSEIKITELFAKFAWDKYKYNFSSSNENFKLDSDKKLKWDTNSSKTLSVFGMLAAYLPKSELLDVFGYDLFADPKNKSTWAELVGDKGIKPFECVASTEEMQYALTKAEESGEWEQIPKHQNRSELPSAEITDDPIPASFLKILPL